MRGLNSTARVFLVVAAVGAWFLFTLRAGHDWGDDFSLYIREAHNLAEGRPYGDTGYIQNPANPVGPLTAPPVFPLLLAPIFLGFGLNLTAMKALTVACFLGSLLVMFRLFREELPEWWAVALIAILGFNPLFWTFKDQVLSDFPFLFFAYAALSLASRAASSRPGSRRSTVAALGAGIVCYLAYGTRGVGAVLMPALVVTDLCRHRRVTRATGLMLVTCLAFAWLQTVSWHSDRSDALQFSISLKRMTADAWFYTKELRDFWRNGYSGIIMRGLFLAMNGFAIFGLCSTLRRGISRYHVFSLLYLAVILSWPNYQGIRYLFPVIPIYLLYALAGLRALPLWRDEAARTRALRLLMGVIAVSYAGRYTTLEYGPLREGIARPEAVELFDDIKRRTPPDAVVVFAKPRALSLFTGRRAAPYHWTEGDEGLLRYMGEIGAGYAITGPVFYWDTEFFRPFLERHPTRFQPVYANATFTMYRIAPAPPPAP